MSKVAFITGASRGIGRAIALRLAKDGFQIALNDQASQRARLEDVRAEISRQTKQKAVLCIGDVSEERQVENSVKEAVNQLGGLDAMVANAGINITKPFIETSAAELRHVLDVNVAGTYLCYKYAAREMIKQGRGGRIIGASSIAGKQGWPMISTYVASKFAIRGLTQAAALEFGKYDITVNAYAPGPVDTDMIRELREDLVKIDPSHQVNPSAMALDSVLGRDIHADEIAGLVAYLVSPDARPITGQCVSINGGLYFD